MKRTGLRAHVKYFALLSLCVIAIVAVLSSAAMGGGGGAIKTLIAGAAQRCVAMYLQYFAIAGLAFWLCYRYRSVQWAHRKIQQLPPAEGQLRQEITSSALAIASLGVLGVLTLYFYRAGFFKIYSDVGAYGYPYAIASVVLAFVFSDVTFYLFHRLSHRPFLFNLYHELHHRSRRPTPWTTRFETVEEVAARYRKQILDVQHEGPYRIAGWSAGGTIAMAIARQLLDSGRTVEFVGLIDTAADYSFLTRRPEWTRGLSADVAKHLSRMDGEAIAQFCKEQGVAFLDHDLDTLRRHIQIGSAICTALEGYSTPRLELAVHLFVSEHSAAQGVDSAWRAVHKNLSVQIIGGDHFSMMKLPHLSTLGASISRAIITSVG